MKKRPSISTVACVLTPIVLASALYALQTLPANPLGIVKPAASVRALEIRVFEDGNAPTMLRDTATEATEVARKQAEERATAESDSAEADHNGTTGAISSNETEGASSAKSATSGMESASAAEAYSYEQESISYEASPPPEGSANTATYRTICIDGVSMSYCDSYGSSSAPYSGAGIWRGSDSTTDGSYGYFIGHNPGSFSVVACAGCGSQVTVLDSNGNSRTYTVIDAFTVPASSYWHDICDRVTCYGESVILQTCVTEGYKILVAA